MLELSGQEIRTARFPQEKRRGYQVDAVNLFMEDLAQYVDVLRGRVTSQERTERSAMLLLQKAQETADQTIVEATSQAEAIRTNARHEADAMVNGARAEAKQRMDGAEAQIEAAFADASDRLNELERQIQARRRELALLEAGSARFAADQAACMRAQADVLLEAASSITSASSADVVDALVVTTGPEGRRHVDVGDPVDVRVRADDLVTG